MADAVTLHAAHHAIRSLRAAQPVPSGRPARARLDDELQRVRTALVQAIQSDGAAAANARPARHPTSQPEPATAHTVAFAPYRKRYADLQRHMELRIAALRAQVRSALSTAAAPLAHLATLDGAMEQMLAARAQQLWSTVPGFLERRFAQLRAARPNDPGGAPLQALAGLRGQPDAWLVTFAGEFKDVLLAELDERLQPVVGLVEAFNLQTAGDRPSGAGAAHEHRRAAPKGLAPQPVRAKVS